MMCWLWKAALVLGLAAAAECSQKRHWALTKNVGVVDCQSSRVPLAGSGWKRAKTGETLSDEGYGRVPLMSTEQTFADECLFLLNFEAKSDQAEFIESVTVDCVRAFVARIAHVFSEISSSQAQWVLSTQLVLNVLWALDRFVGTSEASIVSNLLIILVALTSFDHDTTGAAIDQGALLAAIWVFDKCYYTLYYDSCADFDQMELAALVIGNCALSSDVAKDELVSGCFVEKFRFTQRKSIEAGRDAGFNPFFWANQCIFCGNFMHERRRT